MRHTDSSRDQAPYSRPDAKNRLASLGLRFGLREIGRARGSWFPSIRIARLYLDYRGEKNPWKDRRLLSVGTTRQRVRRRWRQRSAPYRFHQHFVQFMSTMLLTCTIASNSLPQPMRESPR